MSNFSKITTIQWAHDRCYGQMAIDMDDKELCDKLIYDTTVDNLYMKDLCYEAFGYFGDETICEKKEVEYLKDRCYQHVAAELQDDSLCEKIINDKTVKWCYSYVAMAARDVAVCHKYGSLTDIANCYGWVAEKAKDISICEKISEEMETARAKEYCDALAKQSGQNLDKCLAEYNNPKKDDCLLGVARATDDDGICRSITQEGRRSLCRNEVAASLKDSDICQSIEVQAGVDNCINRVARLDNNIDTCDLLSKDELRENCYKEIGGTRGDLEICNKITDAVIKDRCYYRVALTTDNPDLCGGNPGCISDVSRENLNIDACRLMPDFQRDKCYEYFGSEDVTFVNSTEEDAGAVPDPEDEDINKDSDGDGLTDAEELGYGTDPNSTDTDGDGYSDSDEIKKVAKRK